MGYQINYGPAEKGIPNKRLSVLKATVVIITLLTFFVTVNNSFPEKIDRIKQTIFPWSQEGIREATTACIERIKSGETIESAIAALCQEILNENNTSE